MLCFEKKKKAVNKNTVKTSKTWMNVWKLCWAESKGLNYDIVLGEAKELEGCPLCFFAAIRKCDNFKIILMTYFICCLP